MHAAGDPDVHAADRPGAEHHDGVALLDAEQFLGVYRAGERFGRRGLVIADVIGNPVEAINSEHLGRHDHVLGEPAVVLVSHRGLVVAHRHPALAAFVAFAARHRRDDLHAVPHLPFRAEGCVDPGADLDDLTGDLVTDGARRRQVLVAVVEDLDVGAARRTVRTRIFSSSGAHCGSGTS